jgi:tripeptide aminopeptidase
MNTWKVDESQAVERLMRFLAVEGVTGQEKAIGAEVIAALVEVGVPRRKIADDNANRRISLPTQTGNLLVDFPGTRPGPRRMFSTHLDTVPLCAGAKPKRQGGRIVAAGPTALGGDNRTGVGILVTLAATLIEQSVPHPPLMLLFTVREESGLHGARCVDVPMLGEPVECFNFDGRSPQELTIGAVGAERWEAEIIGRASHAGVHPEQGISATAVASLALADIYRHGWFGKVKYGRREGTTNVGVFGGRHGAGAGQATNVVTDYALVRGECRSHSEVFVRRLTAEYRKAFRRAAIQVRNDRGRRAKLRFQAVRNYYPFRLKETAPVVVDAMAAAKEIGLATRLRVTNGGLDANWLTRHGIPTVTIGAGQNNIHTTEEYVEIADYLTACRFAVALATLAE